MRSGIMRFLLVIILALCMCMHCACADVSARITENEWSWEPEGTATFSGAIRRDETGSVLTLQLEISTDPEDAETGRILFTGMNGKKLTLKQQGKEISWKAGEETETSFDGSWFLPSTTGIQKVTIRLKVLDKNGTLLAEETLEKESDENSAMRIGRTTLPGNPGKMTTIVWILAAVLWAGAIARFVLAGRKKKKKRGAEHADI